MALVKNETVIATFDFDAEDVTIKSYNNIMRKATTVAKNSGYETIVSSIISNKQVQVIFTFHNVGYKFVDEMRSSLYRFIDSHKHAATYRWANESVLVNA